MGVRRWVIDHPEWVLLTGVVIFISSGIVSSLFAWRNWRLHRQVRTDIAAVIDASNMFYKEYGRWPASAGYVYYDDQRFGRVNPNTPVFNILQAINGEGNEQHSANPGRFAFITIKLAQKAQSGLDYKGQFVDPWGTPYQLVLDTTLDGTCDVTYSIYGQHPDTGILMWSCGPDGLSDTKDDIVSWKSSL